MEASLLPSATVYLESADRGIVVSANEGKIQMSTYFGQKGLLEPSPSTLIPCHLALRAVSEWSSFIASLSDVCLASVLVLGICIFS